MNDLSAELVLRGVEPDLKRVAAAFQKMRDEIKRKRDEIMNDEDLLARIGEYIRKSGPGSN